MAFLFTLVFLVTALLTGLIRHYAVSRNLLDIPNQRSSHTAPTPRGGGLAIVLTFFSAVFFLLFREDLNPNWFAALASALLVALIGFCDDRGHIAARWRFLVHLLAALCALFFLHGLPPLLIPIPFDRIFGSMSVNLGWLGFLPGAIFLVWVLNLFNFMDGTDGIAASEALFVSAVLAGFLYFLDLTLFKVAICLATACLGFLLWNWPKAKIFMGDVGSGSIGLLLGILILMAAKQSAILLFCGLIAFGVFMVDASFTLLSRFLSGQKWYEAHCSHTYQQAAKIFGHLPVLIACWAINLLWLLPIAVLVFFHPGYAFLGLMVAYLPLIYLAAYFKAGQTNRENP